MQIETYKMVPGKDKCYGYSHPLKVLYWGCFGNIDKDFLNVDAKYDSKCESIDDHNILFECDKYSVSIFIP
jgi:hypothetical protein